MPREGDDMGKRKSPLHATITNGILDEIDEIWNKRPQGTSKSKVIEELLKLGLEAYQKKIKQQS